MAVKTINTELFRKMFLAGAANLEAKKEFINELNVFPVPDGDTGTNMTLTIMSAAKEVQSLENADMLTIAKAISSGSLRGARGNSGVILSQLLRGFTKEIREHKEIDAVILAKACERATATAYKAVMKPKEGTILTVAKGISRKAEELAETTEDLEVFIPEVIKYAEEVLAQTPEMLPVLKEAGVVDSGGQGLLEVIHGAYDAFLGKEIDYAAIEASGGTKMVKPSQQAEADIKFGYCTEFIIMTEKEFTDKNEAEFKAYLESIGDSIVCVADDDIVKIHVHTNDPGLAIQKALTYGQLSRMKIDNMREEHQEKLIKDAEKAAAQQASEKKKKEPKQKKPKQKKPPKPKKEKKPKEVDNTPPLPKAPVIAIVVMIGSLFGLVLLGTHTLGYQSDINQAKQCLAQGNYVEGYENLQGRTVKAKDEELYGKLEVLATVSKKYQDYLVFDHNGSKEQAADALVCAYGRYDLNKERAEEYNCSKELDALGNKIKKTLKKEYKMSGKEALTIYNAKNRKAYTRLLQEKIQ